MNMHCPNCGSTLFHVKENANGQYLCCYKGSKCGWSVPIKPPVPVTDKIVMQ
jgi:DNA-directed RNA polymerase subunit M/transcription elongation factor TFIIS